MLERVIRNGKEYVKGLYKSVKSSIEEFLDRVLMERGKNEKERFMEVLKEIIENGNVDDDPEKKLKVREMAENEILFFDPVERIIGFQTKLDERAVREILGIL